MTDIDLDSLVFPMLLPGHEWQIEKGESAYADTWASWNIYIIRKRRHWFDEVLLSKRVYLDEAFERLKEAGYSTDGADAEPIPADEVDQWRMYVTKAASRLHDTYVEKHRIPIKYRAMKALMSTVEDELNADQNKDESA